MRAPQLNTAVLQHIFCIYAPPVVQRCNTDSTSAIATQTQCQRAPQINH